MKIHNYSDGSRMISYTNTAARTAIERMNLNSSNMSDDNFNKNIVFIVEQDKGNSELEIFEFDTLQNSLIFAYGLYLDNELHSVGIRDKRTKLEHCTDAVNLWDDVNTRKIKQDNKTLQSELFKYQEFIKHHRLEEHWKEFCK